MKSSEKDETNLERVRKAMIEVPVMLEEEEANEALDEEMDWKRWPGNLELRDKKAVQRRNARGSLARCGVESGMLCGGETIKQWQKRGMLDMSRRLARRRERQIKRPLFPGALPLRSCAKVNVTDMARTSPQLARDHRSSLKF